MQRLTSCISQGLIPRSQLSMFNVVQCQQLQVATHNIQDSSLKDECLSHLKYNGYESHWWTLNKDLKDLHLGSKICKLQVCNDLKFICCIDLLSTEYKMATDKIAQCKFFELVIIGMNKLDQQSLNMKTA